jgi:hypothetical protein|tara:strand:+ start:7275 stop:7454 length:180 start_codon:yes stop_codon:yes gene_type:complete
MEKIKKTFTGEILIMDEIKILKRQIQEEVKEKYYLYRRIKELNEKIQILERSNANNKSV